MLKLRIAMTGFIASLITFSPFVVQAAAASFFGPIIACPCPGQAAGWGCVLQTIQNVMNLGISLSVIIATLIIAYAGFLWILSPTNAENKQKGRTMLLNAVIGMVIVLSAWLVVDFFMKTLYDEGSFGPWNSILLNPGEARECIVAKAGSLGTNAGTLTGVAGSGIATGTTATTQTTTNPIPGSTTSGNTTSTTKPPVTGTGNGTVTTSTSGASTGSTAGGRCTVIAGSAGRPCSTANLVPYFGNQAANASSICNAESNGNPTILSGVDKIKTGEAFSVGLFQINITANKLYGCSNQTLNCPAAFNGKNSNATIVNRSLYNQCVQAAQDASCNTSNAARLYSNTSWNSWGANSVCKVK